MNTCIRNRPKETTLTTTRQTHNNDSINNSSLNSSVDFSDAHASDFDLVSTDESDNDSRGLNFASLPSQFNQRKLSCKYSKKPVLNTNIRSIRYKYQCGVCYGPCRENIQDSIQCTLCDEWVHQKCSNLSYEQFLDYCNPVNIDKPYYCDWCEYGSPRSTLNQTCLSASAINSLDSSDIFNMCPNSVFRDKDDIPTTEYYTTDELNVEIQKTPDNLRLIHINAVSLCKHVEDITSMTAKFSKDPSIIFISETRVHDEKEQFQKPQIEIPGYTFVLDNSPTNAGGTAIYVTDGLVYKERDDIIFNYPNVETCFIEIICKKPGHNPIFGAIYRHPGEYARPFCSHLREFLEFFADSGISLTLLGDLNIDLSKTNAISNQYVNTLNSLGFSLLINQPTRIFHYEGSDNVTCSTIDHIITNRSSAFAKSGILIAEVSDHLPIFGIMSLSKPCNNPFKNTYRRFFS